MKELLASMLQTAQLYAAQNTDAPVIEYFGAYDGLQIPPSTRVVVTVRLEHIPDEEVTPIFEMEEAIA